MTGGRESLELEAIWKSGWTGTTADKDLNCRQRGEWTDEGTWKERERQREKPGEREGKKDCEGRIDGID